MSYPGKYCVYVIELSRRIYSEHRRFREANPQFNPALECLYVGMTSKTPEARIAQHLSGGKSKAGHSISSPIVRKYGLYLRPSLYRHIPLMSRQEALNMETHLTKLLRRRRYAVWSN